MRVELATSAQSALEGFYRKEDAVDQFESLYDTTRTKLIQSLPHLNETEVKKDVQGVLELAIDRLVSKFSSELLESTDVTLATVGVPSLLDLSIQGVKDGQIHASVPYKLLDNLMEGQTLSTCEKLWELLESRKNQLPTSDTRASLRVLTMCNALLRRLSKTQNSFFCGRILLFLSFMFPLSEKSAVNLMGKANLANITDFEDEQTFDSGETDASSQDTSMEIDDNKDAGDAGPIDYNLYKTFWNVQRYFRDYSLASKTPSTWDQFMEETKVVLSAFEGNSFSPDDLERSKEAMTGASKELDGDTSMDSATDHFFQPKYLTSSRLFRLQLRDPILRQDVLTQFLILFNHLSSSVSTSVAKDKLSAVQQRAVSLLEQTPAGGKRFSEMLQAVLEREANWIEWKANKCKPFERFPEETSEEAGGKKRKRLGEMGSLGASKSRKKTQGGASALFEQILTASSDPSEILESIKGQDRVSQVPLETYVEKFKEAWDPENGIEEAYWPDKDPMQCWRTLRMTMRSKIEYMNFAVDGAGAVVKELLGKGGKEEDSGDKADVQMKEDPEPVKKSSPEDISGEGSLPSEKRLEKEEPSSV